MKLNKKLMVIGLIPSILLMLFSIFYLIPSIKNNAYAEKDTEIRYQVESAYSILNYYHSLEEKGTLSRKEAQEKALEVVKQIRFGDNGYLWIDDTDFKNVMHPVKPELAGQSRLEEKDANGKLLVKDYINGAIEEKDKGFYSDFWFPKPNETEASPKRGYSKLLESWNWVLSTGIYIDEVEKEVSKQIYITSGVIGLIIIITLLVTYWFSKVSIVKPLGRIVDKMNEISQRGGDLTQRIGYKSKDELGDLSSAFDGFINKLQGIITDVAKSTQVISASGVDLADVTNETTVSIESISRALEEMAAGASEQAKRTHESSEKLKQLSVEINEVSEGTSKMKDYISKTKEANTVGKDYVMELASAVEENISISNRFSEQVEILDNKSGAIANIVSTIQAISEQTNLLALNAAIEAARAGENGRGFAVVAEEIRELSNQTTESTKEIENIVSQIQSEISNTKKQMHELTAVIETTDKASKETEVAFKAIDAGIGAIVNQMEALINSVTQIDEGRNTVVLSVEEISTITEESAASTEEVSAAVEQQSSSMEEIAASADNLKAAAKNLESIVNTFKV